MRIVRSSIERQAHLFALLEFYLRWGFIFIQDFMIVLRFVFDQAMINSSMLSLTWSNGQSILFSIGDAWEAVRVRIPRNRIFN